MTFLKKNFIHLDIIFNLTLVLLWCITKNIVQESLIIGNLSSIFFLLFFFFFRDIFLIKTKKLKENQKSNFINRTLLLNFYLTLVNKNLKIILIFNKNIILLKKVLKLKILFLTLKQKNFNKIIKSCYTRIFFLNILHKKKNIGFNEN